MNGWKETKSPRHMLRERGRHCGVERCQMVYITAGDEWQGKGRDGRITTEKKRERRDTD